MIKRHRILYLVLGIPIFIIVGFIILYFFYGEIESSHNRPLEVPLNAVWTGGVDGGSWIECLPINDTSGNRFFCTVYADCTGDVIYKGAFVMFGHQLKISELNKILGPYTGDEILLTDGRVLKTEVSIDSATYEEIMSRKYEDYLDQTKVKK